MNAGKISAQPFLKIFLLGKFRAEIDGIAVDEKRWTRRSAKSLVKLLALKPKHTIHREQAMDSIWTEQSPETALNNLNKAIHAARRAFEPDLAKGSCSRFILTAKNQIVLDSPGALAVDADEFERLANFALKNNDLEAGQKAVALYRGDLLAEDIYEDWIFTRRESMRILFRKTATKNAELCAAKGEQRAGIEILKKLIAEDASDEFIHRLLMRFHAETGSKYQALKQFEQCRAALTNLGIEPEPETVRIKRDEILPVTNGHKPAPQKPSAPTVSTARITPLTFQNGSVKSAKFMPDGETVIFSAAWNDSFQALYTLRPATGEICSLGVENAEVLSVSPAGDRAILLNPKPFAFHKIGTLAKLSAAGGAPVELFKEIQCADWHPLNCSEPQFSDAESLAIVRDCGGKNRLEFPVGNVICETEGWISHPRFSADGKKITFIEHPFVGDDCGCVVLCDLSRTENKGTRILSESYVTVQGVAWRGDEIWFTAGRRGSGRELKAINLKGEERTIYEATGNLTLHDVSNDGRALAADEKSRVQLAACRAFEKTERDLSWHDWTLPRALADDGETLLFEEGGASGGNQFAAYTRKLDGSAVKKIGDGSALALSPDGKYALARFPRPDSRLILIPTDGAREVVRLETDRANPLDYDAFAAFFPCGGQIIFSASDTNGNKGIYVQNLDGGKAVLFAADNKAVKLFSAHPISPDGKRLILTDSENRLALYQTSGGAGSPLVNLEKDFYLIRWAGDGENLFVWQRGEIPSIVYKYNLASGKKKEWLQLAPKDPVGVCQIAGIKLTPDGKTYAYSYLRESSELYLIENLG
jgi:DNA-binding SARP family transcriptional activator